MHIFKLRSVYRHDAVTFYGYDNPHQEPEQALKGVIFIESIFKRYEKKYLLTRETRDALLELMRPRVAPDRFGSYLVQNLYYDTCRWDVIRASLDKPAYKEKLRLRCYDVPGEGSDLYLELKKKYGGVVYKRRIALPARALEGMSVREAASKVDSQIARELTFYLNANDVTERVYIAYRRCAFAGLEDEGLRVTFDTRLIFRTGDLHFYAPGAGTPILPADAVLMEVKTPGGMPLWLAGALSGLSVFPSSFSKYGACYANYLRGHAPADAERAARRGA